MVSYAENLQEDMQDVGLLDLKVTYDTCTWDYFDEYWNIWDYGQDEYCVYYVLDYYSDSIDSIYERETKMAISIVYQITEWWMLHER